MHRGVRDRENGGLSRLRKSIFRVFTGRSRARGQVGHGVWQQLVLVLDRGPQLATSVTER